MVKLRLPKKVVIIVSGVVVLTGASGATAFFIGKDKILGPSAEELSGVTCTDVLRVADMRRDRAPWLRKYVKVPPGTDGMTRVKTAIRVARKVQESLPADLIEIVVLDEAGPEKRAFMRGRAVGAEVILVRDPSKVPGITQPFTIQYYQGAASGTGMFYGEDAKMTSDEAEALLSKMKDLTDCAPPPGKEPMADAKGEKKHEKKPEKKAEKPAKEGGGHEGAKKEGGKEAKPEVVFPTDIFGKMQKAAFDKAEEAAAAEEEAKHEEEAHKPGFVGKMLGMVGLGGSAEEGSSGHEGSGHEGGAPSAGHEAPAEGGAHGDAGAADHGAAPEGGGHGDSAGKEPSPAAHGAAPDGEKPKSASHEASAPEEAKSDGFLSKMMGMVGFGKDKPKDIIEHSSGPAIVSGKSVPAEKAGHGAAAEPAAHGKDRAPAAHGEAPASADQGSDAGKASGEDHAAPAEHGAAAEPDASAEHGAAGSEGDGKQKTEGADHAAPADHAAASDHTAPADHGAPAKHGAEATVDGAAQHGKPAAEEAAAHDGPTGDAAHPGNHAAAEGETQHPAEDPKPIDHAPAAHGG